MINLEKALWNRADPADREPEKRKAFFKMIVDILRLLKSV